MKKYWFLSVMLLLLCSTFFSVYGQDNNRQILDKDKSIKIDRELSNGVTLNLTISVEKNEKELIKVAGATLSKDGSTLQKFSVYLSEFKEPLILDEKDEEYIWLRLDGTELPQSEECGEGCELVSTTLQTNSTDTKMQEVGTEPPDIPKPIIIPIPFTKCKLTIIVLPDNCVIFMLACPDSKGRMRRITTVMICGPSKKSQ